MLILWLGILTPVLTRCSLISPLYFFVRHIFGPPMTDIQSRAAYMSLNNYILQKKFTQAGNFMGQCNKSLKKGRNPFIFQMYMKYSLYSLPQLRTSGGT